MTDIRVTVEVSAQDLVDAGDTDGVDIGKSVDVYKRQVEQAIWETFPAAEVTFGSVSGAKSVDVFIEGAESVQAAQSIEVFVEGAVASVWENQGFWVTE